MPWNLTTPYDGGTLDPTGVYDQVKIIGLHWRSWPKESVCLTVQYGTTVEGKWVPGTNPAGRPTRVYIDGEDYPAFISHESDCKATYEAAKRGAYEWLFAKGYIDAGSLQE